MNEHHVRVTPNEYLDARRPEWLDAEIMGVVSYDRTNRLVCISNRPDIASAFAVQVSADVRARVIP